MISENRDPDVNNNDDKCNFEHHHGHSHDHDHNHEYDNGHSHDKKQPEKKKFRLTQTKSLVIMHILTGCFFVVELVIGHITKSNALVADAFHMLSDVISLVIALIAVQMSNKTSLRNTFGWVRAEVLGSLVNSVFLLALCFSITIEAINRFVEPKKIENVDLMLYVGCAGLFINCAGLLVFGVHNHEHGHGHSHGGGGGGSHSHNKKITDEDTEYDSSDKNDQLTGITVDAFTIQSDTMAICDDIVSKSKKDKKKKQRSTRNMNMRGVFLHVLSDALGALAVVISGLIIKFVPPKNDQTVQWKLYIDPALSLVITILITITTVPLLKEASLVLLQTVPSQFEIEDLKKLITNVPGVLEIHHFHVWGLNAEKLVATAHVKVAQQNDEFTVIEEIKRLLHDAGIHSTTLQIEHQTHPIGYNYDYCKVDECRKRQCCGSIEK